MVANKITKPPNSLEQMAIAASAVYFCQFMFSRERSADSLLRHGVKSSAESIPTLKNRESIHFDFLLRGFVEKESIHDS